MSLYVVVDVLLLLLLGAFCCLGIDPAQFQSQLIGQINQVRLQHVATYILAPDANLTLTAQSYANSLANGRSISKASTSELTACAASLYAGLKPVLGDVATVLCGENLAYVSDNNASLTAESCTPGEIVQKLWNSQRYYYNYTYPPTDNNGVQQVQDFTQMVWRQTRYVGVGVALGNANRTCFVVARFWPQGNLLNQFTTNVMPPISGSPQLTAAVWRALGAALLLATAFGLN